jgi:hypothetical protein
VSTYDPAAVLEAISDHAAAVLAIGGLSVIAMFVFFIEAARMGARDRVVPMALWMTALWWPHDGSYLLRLGKWFGTYDHWFMELFWFAIVGTFVSESVFVWQTIRYGRDELSPGVAQPVHTLRVLGALACGVISWSLLKGALNDDLYLLSFMGTLLWGCPSASALLGRRRDGRGNSVLEWAAFSAMTILYSITSISFFGGGFFHSWPYVGICVASTIWSLVIVRQIAASSSPMTSRSPRREPCPAQPVLQTAPSPA